MTFACSYCTFATQGYFMTHTYHELMESNITTLYSVMVVPKKIKTIYCRFFLLFIRHTLHNFLYLYYNRVLVNFLFCEMAIVCSGHHLLLRYATNYNE